MPCQSTPQSGTGPSSRASPNGLVAPLLPHHVFLTFLLALCPGVSQLLDCVRHTACPLHACVSMSSQRLVYPAEPSLPTSVISLVRWHWPLAPVSAHHKPLFLVKTAFHKPRRRGAIRKPVSSARLQRVRDRQLPSPARVVHRRQAQSAMAPAGLYSPIRLAWVLLVVADWDVVLWKQFCGGGGAAFVGRFCVQYCVACGASMVCPEAATA